MSRSPNRCLPSLRLAWAGAGIALMTLAIGCGGDSGPPAAIDSHMVASSSSGNGDSIDATLALENKRALIAAAMQLIGTAATNPGGTNFSQATAYLDDYFRDTAPERMAIPPAMLAFLNANAGQFPADASAVVEAHRFDVRWDGLYIEDCLLMRDIAQAVLRRGKEGASDLDRARWLFDWVTQQVQLVPSGSLSDPSLTLADGSPAHVPARPHDVAVRAMATEINSTWAERSWLFLALCRQARLNAGYLNLVLPQTVLSKGRFGPIVTESQFARSINPTSTIEVPFACGIAIDGQVYLFDARLGTPILGPGGSVATLAQAAADPEILAALDQPGRPYPVHASGLHSGKIRVLLEAPHCSLAPRMKLLQEELTGENRFILFRDPTELSADFVRAISPDLLESVRLWPLPLLVEFRQFNDPVYNRAVQYPLQYFNARLPLLRARLTQLRGHLPEAVQEYVGFRFSEDALMADGKTPIPTPVQAVLDGYATYFLALAKLDQGDNSSDGAGFLFRETLRILPEPGRNRPVHFMFRWGAQTNLAHLLAADGEIAEAVRYAALPNPTGQGDGNLLFARSLLWTDPMQPVATIPTPPTGPELRTPGRGPRKPAKQPTAPASPSA